jgi:hypothetical protein
VPDAAQHKAKYEANRARLDAGFAAVDPAWAAVVAFYAAVHLVERLAAADPRGPVHHRNHKDRDDYVQRRHRKILNDYGALRDASETSRYGTVNQFDSQFTAATVQSQLIDTHLVAIEQYVTNHFAPPAPPPAAAGS